MSTTRGEEIARLVRNLVDLRLSLFLECIREHGTLPGLDVREPPSPGAELELARFIDGFIAGGAEGVLCTECKGLGLQTQLTGQRFSSITCKPCKGWGWVR